VLIDNFLDDLLKSVAAGPMSIYLRLLGHQMRWYPITWTVWFFWMYSVFRAYQPETQLSTR